MTRGAACIVTAGLRPTSTMQAESKKEKSGVSVLSRCMLKNCINIQSLLTAFKPDSNSGATTMNASVPAPVQVAYWRIPQ